MTSQLFIPVKVISELDSATLDLVIPARCSRCNKIPALFFETHSLKFRAGISKKRSLRRKFNSEISFRLRLPLCSNCYAKNFIEAPETLSRDEGKLGELARLRSAGVLTASLFACAAFVLLMNVLPLPASLADISKLWLYPMGVSALLFLITLGLTALKNRSLELTLHNAEYDIKLHRAYVIAATLPEEPVPSDVAVFIEMENDGWVKETAEKNGWDYRFKENQPEKDKINESNPDR
jgi:hypothetical protein